MKKIYPRPYQLAAVESVLSKKSKRILVVSPGASGKTVIEALLARYFRRRGKSVLWVVPRRETLWQSVAHANSLGLSGFGVRTFGVDEKPDAELQIATAATIMSREPMKADVVLWDEAHHMVAEGALSFSSSYEHSLHIGFTATPMRLDGKGMDEFYDELVVAAQPSELISQKLISVPRIFCPDLPDLSNVRVLDGEFVAADLGKIMMKSSLVGNVLEHWKKHGRGRRTVGFAATKDHSMMLCARFSEAGVRAAHLDGTTNRKVRDRTLKAFASGQIQIIWNCMLLSEGWDVPECRIAILARPTKSLSLSLQQCNRVARVFDHERPIILDHAGNVLRHGLPYADRDFTLSGALRGSGEAPIRICPECHAANALGAKECEECGFIFWTTEDKLRENDEVLIELTRKRMAERLARLAEIAKKKGFPDTWPAEVVSRWAAVEVGHV